MDRCNFCLATSNQANLLPLYKWDRSDEFDYYCEKHYPQMVKHQKEEKERFYQFYNNSKHFEWLNERQTDMWYRIHEKKVRKHLPSYVWMLFFNCSNTPKHHLVITQKEKSKIFNDLGRVSTFLLLPQITK